LKAAGRLAASALPAGLSAGAGNLGRRSGPATLLVRMVRRRRIVAVGLALLLMILGAAVLAPQLAPYNPIALNVPARLVPPGPAHPFGTDEFGRDILSRTLYGARLSLAVGALVTALAATAGIAAGLVAGTNRRVDRVLMRVMDGLMAFPDILLAIALMASLGPSARNVVIALGFVYTPRIARVVRASVLVVASQEYVEAARAVGAPVARILIRHVLVNTASPVIVQATFITAYAMLGEAALSFLGVGIPPQIPTWGGIISEGQVYLRQAWWISIFPGAAIVLSVLSLNLLGDGLRDFLDPRLRYS
jgi:peptide/nickel transport system permease protein